MYIAVTAPKPDEKLIDIIRALDEEGRDFVVACPDGVSVPPPLRELSEVVFAESCGRGDMLKAALSCIVTRADGDDTVLTMDADRKASPEAVSAVLGSAEDEGGFAIGCAFGGKERKGLVTRLARGFLKVASGISLTDPFSGLRAFKAELIPELVSLGGSGYDFESRCITRAASLGLPVREVPTENGGPGVPADLHALRAALPVFGVLAAFMISSLSSFVIDYAAFLAFSALFRLPPSVYESGGRLLLPVLGTAFDIHVIALVLARCVSSFCNFMFNRKLVFKAGGRSSIIRYYLLLGVMLLLNSGLFTLITGERGLPAWLAQPIVQVILYPLNFILQRKWVFPVRADKGAIR